MPQLSHKLLHSSNRRDDRPLNLFDVIKRWCFGRFL